MSLAVVAESEGGGRTPETTIKLVFLPTDTVWDVAARLNAAVEANKALERICDGYYYASAFKYLSSLLRDPSIMERPPETIFQDVD